MLIENIFNELINNSRYFQVVYPFLKKDYFSEKTDVELFKVIKYFFETYNKVPKFSDLKILIEANEKISIEDTEALYKKIDEIKSIQSDITEELLIKETEKFCQDRAMELAILESVDILQKGQSRGLIEEKIKQALGIQFIVDVGHDYFRDVKDRLKMYLETEDKIPLDIENLNYAMGGGLVKKAIFLFMANTGVGKSIFLCHSTASLIRSGHNVLYLSGELSVKEVNKRLDANMLEMNINELNQSIDKEKFKSKIKTTFQKSHGELLVKYCAAGTVNANHIKSLIQEVKLKKGFVPDVLVLDHLTLFSSSRLPASQTGTHLYIRCVVEEIRSIGIEYDCVVLTACQLNRGSKSKKTEVSNEDVALAYSISETSDLSIALIQSSELKEQNKFLCKVLKTRFSSNTEAIYTVGIDYETMTIKNLDDSQQEIPIHVKDKLKLQQQKKDDIEEKLLFNFE